MLRQFPVKSALPFPLPFGMIQRLARLLVQDLERGSVVGKRGKTDGNRNRTGHILMREGRRTYPGQQALGGLFSDNARHNEDELIPADAGSHIGIAELFLQDGTHPPEDNIPGAVAERIVDAPEIVDVHDAEEKGPFSSQNRLQPSDEGIARKQAGKPVMFRPALQVPVRQTQPPCQRIPLEASQKSLYPQPAVEIMGAKAGDAEHGYMDRVEPCQGWGLRMKSDEDMQKATGIRDNNHPPEPFGQKLRRGGKHDGENDAHAVRVRRACQYPLNMDARQQYYWIRTMLRRAACFTAKATAAYTMQLAR